MKNKLYISKLIVGYYAQNLTKEEAKDLNKWLDSGETHPKLLEQILSEKNIALSIKNFQKYKVESNLYDLHKKIRSQSKAKRIRLHSVFKYAAILLISLLVGAYVLFMNPFNLLQKQPLAVSHGIKQAQLVVAPNLIYNLENQKEIITDNPAIKVENNGQTLIYESDNKIETKSQIEKIQRLIVPRGGEWNLVLSDGTKVWLNAETELKFPQQFLDENRMVELVYGEAYFEVNHDAEHPFIVKSKEGLIEVLGTSFNVRSYLDEEQNVTTLVEGRVKLSLILEPNVEVFLNPGDQATILEEDNIVKIKRVKTSYYTAWKDKRFEFNNEPLEYIMGNIARWYDTEVIFKDEEAKNYQFSVRLGRYEKFESLIHKIELTQKVSIEITHRGIEISKYE